MHDIKEIMYLLIIIFLFWTGFQTGYNFMTNFDTRNYEALELHVYRDSVGKKTIGYGHNLQGGNDQHVRDLGIDPNKLRAGTQDLTKQQANDLFLLDMTDAISAVKELVPNYDALEPDAKIVLNDLCFNMGKGTLATFHNTLKDFNNGNYVAAANDLQKSIWYKQVGHRSRDICAILKAIPST